MEINKKQILDKTHYGLLIYAHILRQFYPGETVVSLAGTETKCTKNPFNDNSPTLGIRIANGSSNHWDTMDSNFVGDCFDFAEQYFKLSGQDLLEKINLELNLRIENDFLTDNEKTTPTFSYFNKPIYTKYPVKDVSILDVYDAIRLDKFKGLTKTLRSLESKDAARKFKAQNFDYVTFSGTFNKRSSNEIIQHSGYITFDFDAIDDINALKNLLINETQFETELIFTSPSGMGVKWIVSFDNDKFSHTDYFKAVLNYFKAIHNIEIDPSGSDVSRACFLCYDNHVYINLKHFDYER